VGYSLGSASGKYLFILVFVLLCRGGVYAQPKPAVRADAAISMQDKLISSTFKTLSKAYINSTDFDLLKKNTIERLESLDTEDFQQRYPRLLRLADDAPVLGKRYGISSSMSVKDAAVLVKSLDKKKACLIIDAVPDNVMADHVREYISERSAAGTGGVVERVNAVWDDIKKRLDKTAAKT